jgi:hypothetical protein
MCDASCFLGADLRFLEDSQQFNALMMTQAGDLRGKGFLAFVADAERSRVESFLSTDLNLGESEVGEDDAAEGYTQHACIHTKLVDSIGIAVTVQLFHVHLKTARGRIHAVGIVEEREKCRPGSMARHPKDSGCPASLLASKQVDEGSRSASSCSSHSGHTSLNESEFVVVGAQAMVNVVDEPFMVNGASPVLQAVLGVSDEDAPLGSLLHDRSDFQRFEDWAHDVFLLEVQMSRGQQSAGAVESPFEVFTFRNPRLSMLGVKLKAWCSLRMISDNDVACSSALLTLHRVQWMRHRAMRLPPRRPSRRQTTPDVTRGTPRKSPQAVQIGRFQQEPLDCDVTGMPRGGLAGRAVRPLVSL